MKVEEQYEDVLQNIESTFVREYRSSPAFKDFEVDFTLDALISYYRREAAGIPQKPVVLNETRMRMFENVKAVLEHRQIMAAESDRPFSEGDKPVEVYLLCFSRIKKSVKFWSKNGNRAYLNFVSKFV